jgi:hypothetical protein
LHDAKADKACMSKTVNFSETLGGTYSVAMETRQHGASCTRECACALSIWHIDIYPFVTAKTNLSDRRIDQFTNLQVLWEN